MTCVYIELLFEKRKQHCIDRSFKSPVGFRKHLPLIMAKSVDFRAAIILSLLQLVYPAYGKSFKSLKLYWQLEVMT